MIKIIFFNSQCNLLTKSFKDFNSYLDWFLDIENVDWLVLKILEGYDKVIGGYKTIKPSN